MFNLLGFTIEGFIKIVLGFSKFIQKILAKRLIFKKIHNMLLLGFKIMNICDNVGWWIPFLVDECSFDIFELISQSKERVSINRNVPRNIYEIKKKLRMTNKRRERNETMNELSMNMDSLKCKEGRLPFYSDSTIISKIKIVNTILIMNPLNL